jgi:hypothetical protein
MDDSRLNKPRYSEQGDEEVDKRIPRRDICSPEIQIEGFR